VSLPFGDPAGAQRFADAVSNPKSPDYRHFIEPDEVGRRFGLPAATVQKVSDYLLANGMKVTLTGKNRLSILADATVAQAQKAFNVGIQDFVAIRGPLASAGHLFSFTTAPMLPADIAPSVLSITGLENFTRPLHKDAITPGQLQTLYNESALYAGGNHGEGRTIGITSFDGFRISNLAQSYQTYSLPAPAGGVGSNVKVSTVASGGAAGGPASGEGDTDLQCVLGMAPLASVIVYDGGLTDVVSALSLEANDNKCDIITDSYGWSLDTATALSAHNLHVAMSTQGVTYLAATGDNGTAIATKPYPLYDPEPLTVGGTSVTVDTSGNRVSELGWTGSGGGWYVSTDNYNIHPAYQVGTGVPTVPYRMSPDVALMAQPGYSVYYNGASGLSFYTSSGTSGAAPTLAGALAVAEQQLVADGYLIADAHGRKRFGRIQDLFYSFNGDPTIFTDIADGSSNGVLPNGGSSTAGVGWDTVTGWGALNVAGLVNKLANAPRLGTLTATPTTLEGGNGTIINATLTIKFAVTQDSTIALSTNDPAITVPASVVIPAGSTTATYTATTSSVHSLKTVQLIAKINGASVTCPISLTPPHVTGFTMNAVSVTGGQATPLIGTVTIAEPAPVGGAAVNLTSSNTNAATVPAAANVPAGSTTGTFVVKTLGVVTGTTVTITAAAGGTSSSAKVAIVPALVSGVSVSTPTTYGGQTVVGTVTLNGQAPPGGAAVTLKLTNTTIASLSTNLLLIPQGATGGTATITVNSVDASTVTIFEAFYGRGAAKEVNLVVKPALVGSVTSSLPTAQGQVVNPTITVTLLGPAGPSGDSIAMSVGPAAAGTIPATLVIPAGATTGTTTFTTKAVRSDTNAAVKAAFFGGSQSVTVKVTAALLSTFTLASNSVQGGSIVPIVGSLTLNGPNGPAPRAVLISSSMPSVCIVPSNTPIPAGGTAGSFNILTKKVTVATTVTITAKLGTSILTQTLTINP